MSFSEFSGCCKAAGGKDLTGLRKSDPESRAFTCGRSDLAWATSGSTFAFHHPTLGEKKLRRDTRETRSAE